MTDSGIPYSELLNHKAGFRTNSSLEAPATEQVLSGPDFLRTLFLLLDEAEVSYCVLHSWERLPEEVPSDLDMAVHPADKQKLSSIFEKLRLKGYAPFQCFNYFANAYYSVFFWFEGCNLQTAAVDIIFEHRRSGLIVPTADELMAGRKRHGLFWVAGPEAQFAYLLAKQTWKGQASPKQALRLRHLAGQLGAGKSEQIAGRIFLNNWKRAVVASCVDGSINEVLPRVRRQPWKTSLRRNPLRLARYLAGDFRRILRRWFHPTGVIVAILGPDGAGKSTLADLLQKLFDRGFRRRRTFHWRPELLLPQGPQTASFDPHGRPSRGQVASAFYLGAFLIDYWIGYLLVIRPLLARSTFIVFDRYFHDVLVDRRRYRYGGPAWLVKLFSRLVPLPDLTLILDAREQVIFARKGELAMTEVQRQREAYQKLRLGLAPTILVSAEQGTEKMVYESARALTEIMSRRFKQRDAAWLGV